MVRERERESKNNRLVIILAIFSILAVSVTAFTLYESDMVDGQNFEVDDISYSVLTETPERTVRITGSGSSFSGTELNLATVTYDQKEYKITEIGSSVFQYNETLISVSFPNVTTAGGYAFQGCTALIFADFPELQNVSTYMFDGCTSLASVNFPKAETIGDLGFYNCESLISVVFEKAETIGIMAFYHCYNLVSVSFPEAADIGESAFSMSENESDPPSQLRTIYFPLVETIGNSCFSNCVNLTSIHLPEVTSIDGNAFYKAGLKNAYLPKLITIGQQAFRETKLVYLDLPKVTTVGNNAFDQCRSLISINLPVVETIAGKAFFSCDRLVSATLSDCVAIADDAFSSFWGLIEINITGEENPEFLDGIKSGTWSFGGGYARVIIVTETGGTVNDYAIPDAGNLVFNGTEYYSSEGTWITPGISNVVVVTFHASGDPEAETKVIKMMRSGSLLLGPLFLKDGHTQKWSLSPGGAESASTYDPANANRSYYAIYSENSKHIITATADDTERGVVTGNGTYYEGNAAKLTATPKSGYTFVKWTWGDDGEFYAPTMYINVQAAGEYIAVFKLNTYEITVTGELIEGSFSADVGSWTGDETYSGVETVTLTATAKTGYNFVGWKYGGTIVSADNPYTFHPSRDNMAFVAVFEARPVYTVTVTGELTNGTFTEDVGSWTGNGTHYGGDTVLLEATPSSGYNFVGWRNLGGVVFADNPYTIVSIGEGMTFFAVFEHITYEVTVIGELTGGTFTTDVGTWSGEGTYNEGETATLKATAYHRYTFVGWKYGGETVSTDNPYTTISIVKNMTFVAVFERIPYEVTVIGELTGGTFTTDVGTWSGDGPHYDGETVTLTATAKSGYKFVGWRNLGGSVFAENPFAIASIGEDMTFVAVFERITHLVTITGELTGGTYTAGVGSWTGNGTHYEGDDVTLTATAGTGYKFVGWRSGGAIVSTDNPYAIISISENKTFIAVFSKLAEYTVTITGELEDGTSIDDVMWTGHGTYYENAVVTLKALSELGFEFVAWESGGMVVSENDEYNIGAITENKTFVAVFKDVSTYTVTITGELEGGTFTTDVGTWTGNGSYNNGTDAKITAEPNIGYGFVGWKYGGEIISTEYEYDVVSISKNEEYIAVFSELAEYTVTITGELDGSPTTVAGSWTGHDTYYEDEDVDLTATGNAGYRFIGWKYGGDIVSTDNPYTIVSIGENMIFIAVFERITYEITISGELKDGDYTEGVGTWTGNGTHYEGDDVTLTATAGTGYKFVGWRSGGAIVSTDNPYAIISIDENKTFVAVFEVIPKYTVTVEGKLTGGTFSGDVGTVTGGNTYHEGGTATLVAVANTGYKFVEWTLDGERVSVNASYTTGHIDDHCCFVAVFEVIPTGDGDDDDDDTMLYVGIAVVSVAILGGLVIYFVRFRK